MRDPLEQERARCVGLVLALVGRARLRHDALWTPVLEKLALEMEYPGSQSRGSFVTIRPIANEKDGAAGTSHGNPRIQTRLR